MRKVVVLEFISLDGIIQAPGGKGEDPSGGFELEGWTVPFFDDITGAAMSKQMEQPFDMLLGKTTFDIFEAYWPKQEGDTAEAMNRGKKYVVSDAPVSSDWKDTISIHGDVVKEIKAIKQQDGPMLQVYGSSNMVQTLLKHDLIDELWLKIFPITLGKGKRLFGEGTVPASYKLIESLASPSGVLFASYARDGEVKTGSFT